MTRFTKSVSSFGWSGMLLVLLMGVYVVGAFVGTDGIGGQIINLLTVGSVLIGLHVGVENPRVKKRITIFLLLMLVVAGLVHLMVPNRSYRLDSFLVMIVYALMFLALFKVVMRREPVTTDKIFVAASVYVLMGICWGLAYLLLYESDPASFNLNVIDQAEPAAALIHFSFTTLTTVGYGSISPMSDTSRAMSDVESVLSQLYLTIVVARLVALQIAEPRPSSDERH